MKRVQTLPHTSSLWSEHDKNDKQVLVIDNFDIREVSLTSQGLAMCGWIREWHKENYEPSTEATNNDGEIRSSK